MALGPDQTGPPSRPHLPAGLRRRRPVAPFQPVATDRELVLRRVDYLATGLACVIPIAAFVWSPRSLAFLVPLWVVSLVCARATDAVLVRANRQGARFLRANDGMVCPKCRYLLRDLPGAGNCPECGRSYTAAELRRLWSQVYYELYWP